MKAIGIWMMQVPNQRAPYRQMFKTFVLQAINE